MAAQQPVGVDHLRVIGLAVVIFLGVTPGAWALFNWENLILTTPAVSTPTAPPTSFLLTDTSGDLLTDTAGNLLVVPQ